MDEATARVADLERRVAALEERSRKPSVATAEAPVRNVDRVLAETVGRVAELRDEVERIAEIQAEVLKVVASVAPGLLPARLRPFHNNSRDAHPAGS
jgi:hypothetical protein